MAHCQRDHRYNRAFEDLPQDQGGFGRHKCAGCAYDSGFSDGLARKEQLDIGLASFDESQAGTIRHRSPHAAYALGYLNGVESSYLPTSTP